MYWIEKYCTLYEGEAIGSPLNLCSYYPEEPNWWADIPRLPDGESVFLSSEPTDALIQQLGDAYKLTDLDVVDLYHQSIAWAERRADWHLSRIENDEHTDWQYEGIMQVFGWETTEPHRKWGRRVRRFRTGNYWVSKKNKKSPTLAAVGLYLLDGDGEPGAKVYLAAADGGQARRIAGSHTLAMVEESPYLSGRSKINQNEMSVSVKATRSKMEPLSSNNSATIKAKEGLNGSALIDEVHVVNGQFMATIDRLGISRSEPLLLGFSTAGDNPDGYGFKQWKMGEMNNESGDNLRHYHLSYHVPQDLGGKELAKDPLAYGRMANAAWGHTVDPDEWLADYDASKVSPAKLHDFLKYRCNQWQRSAADFIGADNWAKCAKPDLRYEDFAKRGGGIGLDISRTDDFSAAVIVQPVDGDTYRVWPVIWVPESRVQAMAEDVLPDILSWADDDHIRVIRGSTVNREILKDDLEQIIKDCGTNILCADHTFASELMEYLETACKIEAVKFPQSYAAFAAPTDDFSSLTVEGNLQHPDNPAFTWQVFNTLVKSLGKKKMPTKDEDNPHRKIDACVAAIMGLKACQIDPGPKILSYSVRGVVTA